MKTLSGLGERDAVGNVETATIENAIPVGAGKIAPVSASELVKQEKEKKIQWMNELRDLDWKNIPPILMAQVLTKKPYRGKAGEPDYYLTPEQALIFAMRCYELGLSPISGEVWFDKDRWTTNITLEGKLNLARQRGNVSPPQFVKHERDWPATAKNIATITGLGKEPGIEAKLTVSGEPCSYLAWMSEWMVPTSPVWKAKPMHMLQVRAFDKALAFASGAGVSDMPDEREIAQAAEEPLTPNIQPGSKGVSVQAPPEGRA